MNARYAAAAVLCAVTLACDRPPKRPPPGTADHALMGHIDRPADGGTVGPEFLVAGWAAGREGVDRVRIYLDDELMETVPVTGARPDVDREYPQYASTGPLHGFGVLVDAGARAGYRALRLEAIDKRGIATYVANVNVRIEP